MGATARDYLAIAILTADTSDNRVTTDYRFMEMLSTERGGLAASVSGGAGDRAQFGNVRLDRSWAPRPCPAAVDAV